MPEKLTYEHVKAFIENTGYELLSNEYVNSKTKIQIKCNNVHKKR
jgi:TusA-related sulfurtransferase